MFKRKKAKLPTGGFSEVTSRLRGFIMDSQIQNGHELSLILGCSAISDDVAEKEEEESDKRLERIEFLIPLLYAYSHALAEGAVEYQRENASPEIKELPEDIWRESRRVMEQSTLSALMGGISQIVDMGLLEIPRKRK